MPLLAVGAQRWCPGGSASVKAPRLPMGARRSRGGGGPPAFGTLEMAVALKPSASAAFEMENKAAAGAERGPTASAGKSHPQRNKKTWPEARGERRNLLPFSAAAGDGRARDAAALGGALSSPSAVGQGHGAGQGAGTSWVRPAVPSETQHLHQNQIPRRRHSAGDLRHDAPIRAARFWAHFRQLRVKNSGFLVICGRKGCRGTGLQWDWETFQKALLDLGS